MHSRIILLNIVCLFLPLTPLAAQASNSSLLRYKLSDQEFPKALRELVRSADAGALMTKTNKTKARQALQTCRRRAKELRSARARGLHDELFEISGYCAEHLGAFEDAYKDYEQSLNLRSSNSRVRFRRALLLQQQEKHAQAIREFNEVLWESKSAHHEILYSSAKSLLALDKQDEAFKVAEQGRIKSPGFLPLLRLLIDIRRNMIEASAVALEKAQLEAQIAADLTVIASQDPSDRVAGLALVRLLLKNSDPLLNAQRLVEAEQIAQRFATASNFKDDESVRLLFDTQLKRGDMLGAEATLDKGRLANPESETLATAAAQLKIEQQLKAEESVTEES